MKKILFEDASNTPSSVLLNSSVYKENLTTGAKQSLGVYYELDVTSNIIVSGEPTFELVEC